MISATTDFILVNSASVRTASAGGRDADSSKILTAPCLGTGASMGGSAGTNGVAVVRRRRRKSRVERVLDAFLGHALRRRPDGRLNVEGALEEVYKSNPLGYVKLTLTLEDFEAELEAEEATPPFDIHVNHYLALMERGPGAIDDEGNIVPVGREARR